MSAYIKYFNTRNEYNDFLKNNNDFCICYIKNEDKIEYAKKRMESHLLTVKINGIVKGINIMDSQIYKNIIIDK